MMEMSSQGYRRNEVYADYSYYNWCLQRYEGPPQDNRDADPSREPGGMSQVFEDVQVLSPDYRYECRYPM